VRDGKPTKVVGAGCKNGGFYVQVKNTTTGTSVATRIDIDLDGLTDAGAAGFGDDTTLEDIAASLDAVDGIAASVAANGTLEVDAESGFEFGFSDDSSGVPAVLGVNSFFTGRDGADIGVREELIADSGLLAVGRLVDGTYVENGTAMEISGVQDRALDVLGGGTLRSHWNDSVQTIAIRTATAESNAQAAGLVRESLEAQRSALSGVSTDEEAINMLNAQRSYQGAARYLDVVDQMTQVLLGLV